MQDLLEKLPECRFEPENPASLAAAARFQLQHQLIPELTAPTWQAMGERLEAFFVALLRAQ
jgi:hypothetical protein